MEEDNRSEEEKRREELKHLYDNENKYDDPIEGDPTKIKINPDVSENIKGIWAWLKELVAFKDGADVEGTIRNIREGINFKGPNAWVLMCSIIVASVGLNTNSVAVIIGAMLISPLMGPIRGIGLGVGTNDISLFFSSLKNFGIAVGISLVTAWLYFLITPLAGITQELSARTGPNLMDVFIAFFGGLAGIIAASRGDNNTVVPGVAIATALMPPLCTAGYGLAEGNWSFFFGASYLFLLNTLFICLSTIVVVRYLKFPLRHFLNPRVEKKAKWFTYIMLFLVVTPAVYLFYNKVKETVFQENARNFVENELGVDPTMIVKTNFIYDGDSSKVELYLTNRVVGSSQIEVWENEMKDYNLEASYLKVYQGEDMDSKLAQLKKDFETKSSTNGGKGYDLLEQKEKEVNVLKEELSEKERTLALYNSRKIDVEQLRENIKLNHPLVDQFDVLSGMNANTEQVVDSVFAIAVHYKDSLKYVSLVEANNKLKEQFRIQLKSQGYSNKCTIKVFNY